MPLSRPALAPRGGRGGLRSLGNRLIVLCVVAVVALSLSVSALTAASDVPSATGTAEPPRYSDAAFVRAQLRRLVATPHNDYGAITNAGKNNNIGSAATETADAAAPVSLRQAAAASMAETHARLEPLLRLFTPSLNAPTAAHSNRGRKRSIDSEAESEPEPAAAVGEVWSRARDWLLGTITVPPEVSRVVAALVPAPLLAALSQPRQSSVTVGSGTEGESESESARAVGVVSEWLRQQWLHLNGAPDTEPDTQASTMSSSNNDGNGEAEAARAVRFLLQSTVDGTTASGDLDSIALALKSVSGDVSASSGLSTSRHIDPLAHLVFPDSDIDGDVEESHHAPATAARAQAAPALHRRPKLSSKASAVDHLTAKRSRSSSKDGDALGGQGYFSPKGHLPKGYLHHVDVSRLKAVSKSVTTAPAVFYSRPARAARATGAAGAAGFAALAGADAEPDSEFDFVEFPAVEATVVYPGARAWSAGEAFPCNQGRLTTATKQEWQNNGTVVDQAAAEAVLATPARANNYLDDVSTSEGFAVPACTQVSFFANETWLGNYLPTILSPEQIAELEGKPRLDFMQAVCAVVDARSPPDSTTVTTTNRAATLSVTDRDMCTRWRQCSAHALIAHYNYETSVCLCPYDAGGLLCANPRRTHCSAPLVAPAPAALECDIAAPASAHWPASFGNNYDAELFGPKPCHRFYPVSAQPADVPLAPGLSPADAGAARGTLRLTSRPQCAFGASADDTTTVTPIQGVSQYVQRVLALDGYTWDTAYNFTYYAFRPADNSSEASEARRDDPDAVAPLFAISARRDPVTGIQDPTLPAAAYAYTAKVLDMNRITSLAVSASAELTPAMLSALDPVVGPEVALSLTEAHARGLTSGGGLNAGGRIHVQAAVAVVIVAAPAGGGADTSARRAARFNAEDRVRLSFEDMDYNPGGARGDKFSDTDKWIVISVCVAVGIIAIIVVKLLLKRKERRYFERARRDAARADAETAAMRATAGASAVAPAAAALEAEAGAGVAGQQGVSTPATVQ